MSKHKWVARMVMCGFVISMTGGCGDQDHGRNQEVKFQHRLVKVDCAKELPADKDVKVEVENSKQVLKDIIDDVIAVCENDEVTWFTTDSKILIHINFKDPYGEELFGTAKFGSKNGELKTPTQKVKHQGNKHDQYSYSIDITDLEGKPLQSIDPHIIPM
jgi:hypothetical protein